MISRTIADMEKEPNGLGPFFKLSLTRLTAKLTICDYCKFAIGHEISGCSIQCKKDVNLL